jgi:hypothetical protein
LTKSLTGMAKERTSPVKEDISKLAYRMVHLLAGVGSRRAVTPDEIVLWLGSARRMTKTSMELAISNGWIERKEQGVILLKAGKQMLRRPS